MCRNGCGAKNEDNGGLGKESDVKRMRFFLVMVGGSEIGNFM